MKTKTIFILAVIATLALCITVSQPAIASDEDDVLQVEKNFVKAISTGDYQLMSSLYWHSPKTSTFNPNNDPFLSQGWEESLAPGWKDSLSSEGNTTAYAHNLQAFFLKDDVAVITVYENVIDINAITNEQTVNNFRFTRVVQKIDGKWLIVHDHASDLP